MCLSGSDVAPYPNVRHLVKQSLNCRYRQRRDRRSPVCAPPSPAGGIERRLAWPPSPAEQDFRQKGCPSPDPSERHKLKAILRHLKLREFSRYVPVHALGCFRPEWLRFRYSEELIKRVRTRLLEILAFEGSYGVDPVLQFSRASNFPSGALSEITPQSYARGSGNGGKNLHGRVRDNWVSQRVQRAGCQLLANSMSTSWLLCQLPWLATPRL